MLGDIERYKTLLNYFHGQSEWAVDKIEDPQDADEQRSAVIACVTTAMVRDFKRRDVESNRSPNHDEPYWAKNVKSLPTPLFIPDYKGSPLPSMEDGRAWGVFKAKNICIVDLNVR